VEYNGQQSVAFPLRVARVAPGIYTLNSTGSGQAAAINQDGTFNGPPGPSTVPAAQNAAIVIFATGGGQTNPPSITGSVSPINQLLRLTGTITATIGGQPATVEFAGAAPGLVTGVIQLNLRPTPGVRGNALQVVITIDGISSPLGPTVAIQ
jgi:uncharacterized protein (TIGR03437 family)